MKQQTAVDWLVSQLNKQGFAEVVTDEEIEQAKEMEKEQIKNAYTYDRALLQITAEQYYNETYGGNK
jgi:vacuolar-type H+-ATPase subunit H